MAAARRAMGNSDGCRTVNDWACRERVSSERGRSGGATGYRGWEVLICGTNFAFPIARPAARLTPLPLDRKTRYAIAPASLCSSIVDAPYVITPLDFGNTAT